MAGSGDFSSVSKTPAKPTFDSNRLFSPLQRRFNTAGMELRGEPLRVTGIDEPERGQLCATHDALLYDAGKTATTWLRYSSDGAILRRPQPAVPTALGASLRRRAYHVAGGPRATEDVMSGSASHREEKRPPGMSAAMWQAIRQRRRTAYTDALPPGTGYGHPEIDRRVLAMTRIIVRKIDADPTLVRTGLDNIARWTRQKGGYVPLCHAEWKALIKERPWRELRAMLLEESDEGQRLRSSHPFTGLITDEERAAVYAA